MKLKADSLKNKIKRHQGKKRAQINIIRTEKGKVISNTIDIQRIIKDYCEQ